MPNIKPEFRPHNLNDEGVTAVEKIRAAYSALLETIEANAAPSRERSVAITELQTSSMWAVRAVAVDERHQAG